MGTGGTDAAHREGMKTSPVIKYLHCDLETTGLDKNGEIIQFGIIGATADYEPLFEVDVLVQPTARTMQLIDDVPFVTNMMTENGLLDELKVGLNTGLFPSIASVEQDIIRQINRFSPDPSHRPTLAGSGVATFDYEWLKLHTPELAAKLQYWTNDVGVMRREWRDSTGDDLVLVDKSKTHRAFDDVGFHTEEARAYRTLFSRIGALAGGGDIETVTAWLDAVEARDLASVLA